MTANAILIFYIVFWFLENAWEILLEGLNIRHADKALTNIPQILEDHFDEKTRLKSADYAKVKGRFSSISGIFSSVFLLALIVTGGFGYFDNLVANWQLGSYTHGVVFIFLVSFLFTIISLPWNYYSTFVIEQRFGFNQMTTKLFVLDTVKGLLISIILLTPILYLLFYFMDVAGSFWWIYAWGAMVIFQLSIMYIYPTVIAPLFNKFTPFEDRDVKDAIFELASKTGFKLDGLFKMDGSKRSKHSNAYFTGFGKQKRIVLFDTLINSLNLNELLAVLAHEIGHEKKHHIKKGMALSILTLGIGFWALSLFLNYEPIFQAFGFENSSYHAALVIISFASGPFTFFLSPLGSMLSRKHEYEADAFACKAIGDQQALKSALVNLGKENLSNLVPHPWYSAYHYSHPTLAERIFAIDKVEI